MSLLRKVLYRAADGIQRSKVLRRSCVSQFSGDREPNRETWAVREHPILVGWTEVPNKEHVKTCMPNSFSTIPTHSPQHPPLHILSHNSKTDHEVQMNIRFNWRTVLWMVSKETKINWASFVTRSTYNIRASLTGIQDLTKSPLTTQGYVAVIDLCSCYSTCEGLDR